MNNLESFNDNLEFNFSSLSLNLCKMCNFKVENNNNLFCNRCYVFKKYLSINHFKNCNCIYCNNY